MVTSVATAWASCRDSICGCFGSCGRSGTDDVGALAGAIGGGVAGFAGASVGFVAGCCCRDWSCWRGLPSGSCDRVQTVGSGAGAGAGFTGANGGAGAIGNSDKGLAGGGGFAGAAGFVAGTIEGGLGGWKVSAGDLGSGFGKGLVGSGLCSGPGPWVIRGVLTRCAALL